MTLADREAHVPSVSEEVVGVVEVTTLSRRQYCVVLDPVGPDGKPQLGQKKVVKVGTRAGPARLDSMAPLREERLTFDLLRVSCRGSARSSCSLASTLKMASRTCT